MKKIKISAFLVLMLIVISVSTVYGFSIPANDHAKDNARSPENSPVIDDDWNIERMDFVHYIKPQKPGRPNSETCFKLLGFKWLDLPVKYSINPTNPNGLSEIFVKSSISASAETWDAATSREIFDNSYSVDYTGVYGRDSINTLLFNEIGDSNTIAVTSIWYNRVTKKILEFDVVFNTKFAWGDATADPSVMDLQNIAVHEIGHGTGLNDIYSTSCSAVTMYGYSTEGEISKRTLENSDITGLQKMYGV